MSRRTVLRATLALISLWYRACLLLTRVRHPLTVHADYTSIASALSYGRQYKADPLKGIADYITHPRRVQRRIDNGQPIGDCDDHAAYWCAAVELAGLCVPGSARLGIVRYRNAEGKLTGHVVALWVDAATGDQLWADYGAPNTYLLEQWAVDVCARRGARYRWHGEVLRGAWG